MKHYGIVWEILLVLEFQMNSFTLKIVAYFKCLTCLCSRAQGTCFWEVTANAFNSQGQQLKKTLPSHLCPLTALGELSKIDYKNTFRRPINIYNTVSVLIQHYYFQGQYYTCSFLELHILVLFLTSDRASCTVASSTLFTNTPKLQLLILPAYLAMAKRRNLIGQ